MALFGARFRVPMVLITGILPLGSGFKRNRLRRKNSNMMNPRMIIKDVSVLSELMSISGDNSPPDHEIIAKVKIIYLRIRIRDIRKDPLPSHRG